MLQQKIQFAKARADVSRFDENLAQLLLDLEDTMYEVESFCYMCPQIGILQKVAIIDMEIDGLLQLINPKIIRESDQK